MEVIKQDYGKTRRWHLRPQRRHQKSEESPRKHRISLVRIGTDSIHLSTLRAQSMTEVTKLRINLNSQAIVKLAGLVSNSIILSTNVFLIGTNFRRQIKEKKTEAIANKLQLTAEVAQAIAGLSKVIVKTLETYEKR